MSAAQVRQARARPLLDSLHEWLQTTLVELSKKSAVATAISYALGRWPALVRYCGDGLLEIDNNSAERVLRAVALGRKNYLFAGSDSGGERGAAIHSLIGSAKLNGLDPEAYLRDVLIYTERVTLQLSPDMRDKVDALARELQRSKSSKDGRITANTVMRVAIRHLLKHYKVTGADVPNGEEELLEAIERRCSWK